MRKLFVIDWDDSLRIGYSAVDWISSLHNTGLFSNYYYKKLKQTIELYKTKKIDYNQFVNVYADIYFKGTKSVDSLQLEKQVQLFAKTEIEHNLSHFALDLIDYLKNSGYTILVISGSPQILVSQIFNKLIKDGELYVHGITEDNSERTYSGSSEAKVDIFKRYVDDFSLIGAIGDSPGDYEILKQSDFGFIVGEKVKSSLLRLKKIYHHTEFEELKNHIKLYEYNAENILSLK